MRFRSSALVCPAVLGLARSPACPAVPGHSHAPAGLEDHGPSPVEDVLSNPDLLKTILVKLNVLHVVRASSTCRAWRDAAESDDFWAEVDFSSRRITREQVRRRDARMGPALCFGTPAAWAPCSMGWCPR